MKTLFITWWNWKWKDVYKRQLATVFCITNFIDTDELALVSGGSEVAAIMGLTKVAALAYLMFNLFTPPCFAALGEMCIRDRNSWKKQAWSRLCAI